MISVFRSFLPLVGELLLLLFVVFSPLQALSSTPIRVGVYDFDPLSKTNISEKDGGFLVNILKYVAQEEKWQLQFIPGTLQEGFQRLQNRQIDLLVAAPYSDNALADYDFTREATISTWAQIYSSSGNPVIQSLLDLKDLTIGVVRDDPYNQELRNILKRLNVHCDIVEFNSYAELFNALQDKWINAGAVDRFYGILHAKDYAVVVSPIIFSPVELRYAIVKNHQSSLIKTLNYHIDLLKKNPDSIYFQLVDQMAGTSRDSRLYKILLWGIILTICFLCIMALMIFVLRSQIRKKTGQLTTQNEELEKEIVKRCEAEEALRESEELYRTLAERSFANVYVVQDGKFCFINSNTVRTLGYAPEEIIGQRSLHFVHEDDREQVKAYSQNMRRGLRTSPYEYRMMTSDGNSRWMLETVTFIQYAGREAVLGTAMDISEQKRAEEERHVLESQLRQAQKMEAIGTLAGGIAHDFNNILAAVIGYSELAYRRLDGHEREKRYLNEVLKACERAKELIKQILTFSRSDERTFHPLSVTPVVKEAVKLLRASLPTTIEIKMDLTATEDTVLADPTQIHQILMNLCTNAAHAMNGKGGTLTIGLHTGAGIADEATESCAAIPPQLELTVADTGQGISPAIRGRIFDPFFTTKEVGKGTGMGLAVVHGIVKGHGGIIRVESEVNKGSTFRIYLPLTGVNHAEPEPRIFQSLPEGKERILWVDDEEVLVEMGREMFSRLGYHVTTATRSKDALEVFRRHPDSFDLVITDMTMPEVTGLQLSRKLVDIKSDIDVILCSGYSEDITPESLAAAGICEYIAKPFNHKQIAMAIRHVLDREKPSLSNFLSPM